MWSLDSRRIYSSERRPIINLPFIIKKPKLIFQDLSSKSLSSRLTVINQFHNEKIIPEYTRVPFIGKSYLQSDYKMKYRLTFSTENTVIQNSLDEYTKTDKRFSSIGQPPLSRQSSVIVKTPLNNKCNSPVKATLVSLPNDTVTNGYFPQHINQIVNYPRPPSLIYDCNRLAYKQQPTKCDNDENTVPSTRKSQFSENVTSSVIQRINDNLSNISFNDKYILSFNYLCASAFNPPNASYRNSIQQAIKPLSESSSIDCLSIKPATKFPSTKIDRFPKYSRELFPYPDPYPKASRSFINRLTEISILTQNTVRLEKNKNKRSMIKRNSNDLAIFCKD